jgi:hypothetical protein
MIKYEGKVVDGKLLMKEPMRFKQDLKNFDGKEVVIEVKLKKKFRSHPQNDYYWRVIVKSFGDIFNKADLTLSKEQIHDILKTKFLLVKDPYPRIKSTTELTTLEFNDYILQLQEWAASEFKCYIPDPNESGYQINL